MTFRYTSAEEGGWIAFVVDDRALVLGGPLDEELLEGSWGRLEGGAASILELLTSRGLQATPSFALVEPAEGGTRVIVRGAVTVNMGADAIDGAGAATWIERVLPSAPLSVDVHGATSSTAGLPIVRGAVAVARLSRGVATPAPSQSPPVPPTRSVPDASEETIAALPTDAELESPPAEVAGATPTDDGAGNGEGSAENDYDYLFGATMYRSVSDAAVQPEANGDEHAAGLEDAPGSSDAAVEGDHDGATMLVSQLGRPRGRQRAVRPDAAPTAPTARVVVTLPGGGRELLDEPLVLGRAPSVSGIPSGQVPRLITVIGGDQDISRSHLRAELQGGTIVVTDLHSKNGTTVTLPGQSPMKLRGGEPTPVIVGTVINLGGVLDVSVQEV